MSNLSSLLNVSVDDAYEISKKPVGNTREKDERLWKPSLTKDRKEYQACVRPLPRGIVGLQNRLSPTVEQHTHFIKERVGTKSDGTPIYMNLTVKCRKTLGKGEKCPICEANWATYNHATQTANKALKDQAYSRRNIVSHIGNFYIREDLTQPQHTGIVKLWDHTDKMNNVILDPTRPEDANAEQGTKGFKKKKERFTPYSPVNGRDFFVIVQENPQTGITDYGGSYWDENGLSDLAPTEDEIMAILEQCHDLSEFVNNVQSAEDLSRLYGDFLAKVAEKTNTQVINPMAPVAVYVNESVASTAPKGNVNDLLNVPVQQVVDTGAKKPVQAPIVNPQLTIEPTNLGSGSLLTSDDDDDGELPF